MRAELSPWFSLSSLGATPQVDLGVSWGPGREEHAGGLQQSLGGCLQRTQEGLPFSESTELP